MVLQCLTWISYFWGELVCSITFQRKGFVRPLPDDIIIDILSRLPVDCVLECRKVCRQWLSLTSTPYFSEMHLKRASPVLFVQCNRPGNLLRNNLDMFILDEGAKKEKITKKMLAGSMCVGKEKYLPPVLFGSCNGLILFRPQYHDLKYFVCNPVTREQITIGSPVRPGMICGFFFHPLSKEYKVLYVHQKGICFEYFIYSLKGKLWRKLDAFSYWPTSYETPTILNGNLHWMVEHKYKNEYDIPPCSNSIMMFNMDTEVFCSMPHPGKECRKRLCHGSMHLLEMEGELSLYYMSAKLFHFIWVLEDYENWFWVAKYKFDLGCGARLYPIKPIDIFDYPDFFNSAIRLLDFRNGELLVDWYSNGLFRYHLGQNTARKIDRAGMKISSTLTCYTTLYIKSFVSPGE